VIESLNSRMRSTIDGNKAATNFQMTPVIEAKTNGMVIPKCLMPEGAQSHFGPFSTRDFDSRNAQILMSKMPAEANLQN
jgi:hypothetical protein